MSETHVSLQTACVKRIRYLLGPDWKNLLHHLHVDQKVIEILKAKYVTDTFSCHECLQ